MQKEDMKTKNCYCFTDRCLKCIYFVTEKGGTGYVTRCKFDKYKQPGFLEKLIQRIKGE